MKFRSTIGAMTLLTMLLLLATPALAVYTQPASNFSAGGGETSSANYTNLGVIGQPAVVGSSSSVSYTANHGFLSVLGDGFKILYPEIAVSPGTLTFSIMATTYGDQALGISNTGGSNLAWTVIKNAPDSIFSFTTSTTGTNAGSVTVRANATNLSPGTYSNSLTVSGAGIERSAQVLLDLTVTPYFTYTLAVTLKLATPEKGGGTVTSSTAPVPPDLSFVCQRTGGTSEVTCQAEFPANSTVTLHQTPDSNTTWATWGAPGCGTNEDCQIVLNEPKGTTVTFPYSSMAKINIGTGYESLVLAYAGAVASDTIKTRAVIFVEGTAGSLVTLNSAKTISLLGGLDAYYAPTSGYTTLRNVLKIVGS